MEMRQGVTMVGHKQKKMTGTEQISIINKHCIKKRSGERKTTKRQLTKK